MAARQDQTLQIFLIVFIFLFLVSAVVAYLGWKGYSEAEQRAVGLQNSLNDKNTQVNNLQTDLEDHREMTGFNRNDNTADVKEAFKNDMEKMGAGVEEPSYRKVLETVFLDQQQTAANEATLKQKYSELTKDKQAVESAAQKQIAAFQEAMKKAEEDAAAERNRFAADRQQLEKTKAELQKTLEQQRTNYEGQISQRDTRIKELEGKVGKLERAVQNLIEQVPDDTGSFEVPDGRISWVNQGGTVWINLGSADSLRRQVTFSVYDSDLHDAEKATKKGSIEVTRIMGDHLAEARITEETPTDPILTGDFIFSQVWHRGKALRFALTGFIDFDGDSRSDAELARELIVLNGGIVDAYVTEDGKVEGEISAHTRYLVLGDEPRQAAQGGAQQAWHEMSKEASSLGVETIGIHEFLNQMGYKPQDRSVQLGSGASAIDFPARPEGKKAVPRFRPRTPAPTR